MLCVPVGRPFRSRAGSMHTQAIPVDVGAHSGGAERTAQTMNGGLVRGALMLSRDPIATIASMVGNVTNDLAPGAWRREDGEFVTSTCTYREFFKTRDMEFLTATTCCSLDVDVWFSGLDAKSATVTLESSMARGDPECRISVRAGEK